MWGFLGSKTFPCSMFGAISDSQDSLGSQLSFWEISGLLRKISKWEAWNGEREINWTGKHELNSLSYHFGWGLYRVRNLLKTIIWKKWSCSDCCFISSSVPYLFCECCVQPNETPFIHLAWAAVQNLPYWGGFCSPRDSLGIWGQRNTEFRGAATTCES